MGGIAEQTSPGASWIEGKKIFSHFSMMIWFRLLNNLMSHQVITLVRLGGHLDQSVEQLPFPTDLSSIFEMCV